MKEKGTYEGLLTTLHLSTKNVVGGRRVVQLVELVESFKSGVDGEEELQGGDKGRRRHDDEQEW